MTSQLRLLGLLAGLAIGAGACSGDSKGGAEKFAGAWTSAGSINPNCFGLAAIDLTGLTAVITASDSSHIDFALGNICTIKFNVDGSVANAASGQSCMFDVGAPVGLVTVMITKWTLHLSGDVITSDFTGSGAGCMPTGTDTLTRQGGGDAAAVD